VTKRKKTEEERNERKEEERKKHRKKEEKWLRKVKMKRKEERETEEDKEGRKTTEKGTSEEWEEQSGSGIKEGRRSFNFIFYTVNLDVVTKCRCLFSITLRSLHPWGNFSRYPLGWKPQSRSGRRGEEKNICPIENGTPVVRHFTDFAVKSGDRMLPLWRNRCWADTVRFRGTTYFQQSDLRFHCSYICYEVGIYQRKLCFRFFLSCVWFFVQ
jgi:hypothetical protein